MPINYGQNKYIDAPGRKKKFQWIERKNHGKGHKTPSP